MKTSILSSTILSTVLSVSVSDHLSTFSLSDFLRPQTSIKVDRVTGPDECNIIEEFDQESCTCFKKFQCRINCQDPRPILNPTSSCQCISQEAYDSIFVHDLGSSCGAEPEVQVIPEKTIEVERVTSQEECDIGFTFDQSACACFSDLQCRIGCIGDTPRNNPLSRCGCISEANYQSIFSHDLGLTCGAEPEEIDDLSELDADIDQGVILVPPGPEFEVCAGGNCGDDKEDLGTPGLDLDVILDPPGTDFEFCAGGSCG